MKTVKYILSLNGETKEFDKLEDYYKYIKTLDYSKITDIHLERIETESNDDCTDNKEEKYVPEFEAIIPAETIVETSEADLSKIISEKSSALEYSEQIADETVYNEIKNIESVISIIKQTDEKSREAIELMQKEIERQNEFLRKNQDKLNKYALVKDYYRYILKKKARLENTERIEKYSKNNGVNDFIVNNPSEVVRTSIKDLLLQEIANEYGITVESLKEELNKLNRDFKTAVNQTSLPELFRMFRQR